MESREKSANPILTLSKSILIDSDISSTLGLEKRTGLSNETEIKFYQFNLLFGLFFK